MKKILGTVLAIVLVSSILAGCGKDETTGTETTPAATDDTTPFATDDTATGAGAATEDTGTADATPAIDLTDYPVMWCMETTLSPKMYDLTFLTELASETYDENYIIGTTWIGYRLIDDTHIELFSHYRLNDDIDTSIMVTSQEEKLNEYNRSNLHVTKISDREEEMVDNTYTYTYEINGTELIITDEQTSATSTLQFSSDFTSIVDGPYEYTYLTDF